MGLKGNPVKFGSGPAAVILIPINSDLYCIGIKTFINSMPLVESTGKADRGPGSQKTNLDKTSQKRLRGKRL